MKVYVYDKKTRERVNIIEDVENVFYYNGLYVITVKGEGEEILIHKSDYMVSIFGY